MDRLLNRLRNHRFSLLVSLPRNDAALATAAIRGGAHGLKIHINVEHFASGTRFGSFAEEKASIAAILDAAGEASVGIVPGGSPFATEADFAALAQLGVDYFDAYPADAPAWTLTQSHLGRMLAAFEGAPPTLMAGLVKAGMQMCEASIVNHDHYGTPLNTADIGRYAELTSHLPVPVIVPSQKHVVPADIPALAASGVRGLLIGAIVTGKEAASIESATRAFAAAIDALPGVA